MRRSRLTQAKAEKDMAAAVNAATGKPDAFKFVCRSNVPSPASRRGSCSGRTAGRSLSDDLVRRGIRGASATSGRVPFAAAGRGHTISRYRGGFAQHVAPDRRDDAVDADHGTKSEQRGLGFGKNQKQAREHQQDADKRAHGIAADHARPGQIALERVAHGGKQRRSPTPAPAGAFPARRPCSTRTAC